MAAALPILGKVATGLLGSLIGGKKKAAPTAATTVSSTAATGRPKPIITQLGSPGLGGVLPPRPANPAATLLSSKLGG